MMMRYDVKKEIAVTELKSCSDCYYDFLSMGMSNNAEDSYRYLTSKGFKHEEVTQVIEHFIKTGEAGGQLGTTTAGGFNAVSNKYPQKKTPNTKIDRNKADFEKRYITCPECGAQEVYNKWKDDPVETAEEKRDAEKWLHAHMERTHKNKGVSESKRVCTQCGKEFDDDGASKHQKETGHNMFRMVKAQYGQASSRYDMREDYDEDEDEPKASKIGDQDEPFIDRSKMQLQSHNETDDGEVKTEDNKEQTGHFSRVGKQRDQEDYYECDDCGKMYNSQKPLLEHMDKTGHTKGGLKTASALDKLEHTIKREDWDEKERKMEHGKKDDKANRMGYYSQQTLNENKEKMNPVGSDGKYKRCNVCESETHMTDEHEENKGTISSNAKINPEMKRTYGQESMARNEENTVVRIKALKSPLHISSGLDYKCATEMKKVTKSLGLDDRNEGTTYDCPHCTFNTNSKEAMRGHERSHKSKEGGKDRMGSSPKPKKQKVPIDTKQVASEYREAMNIIGEPEQL